MSENKKAYDATRKKAGQIAKALEDSGIEPDMLTVAALLTLLGGNLVARGIPAEVAGDLLRAIVLDDSHGSVAVPMGGGGIGVISAAKHNPGLLHERDYVARVAMAVEALVSHFHYSKEDIERVVQGGIYWSSTLEAKGAPPAGGEA